MTNTTKTWIRILLLLMGFYCIEVKSNVVTNTHNLNIDLTTTEVNKKFF